MSKRRSGPSEESLAEALSRVVVTAHRPDHHRDEAHNWATQEGRGDRMPRFLERAIEDVPHASSASSRTNQSRTVYQGRNRKPYARITFLMSTIMIGVGVGVSFASPSTVAPLLQQARHYMKTAATWNINFAPKANAATPRLKFGEALRNYTERAEAEAARANIIVSNLTPGTMLSAGEPVTETSWTLPQSGLDHVVITFPEGTPKDAMRATVEIPGNTTASSGKFSVELRQADSMVEDADKEKAAAAEQDQQDQAEPPKTVAKQAAPATEETAQPKVTEQTKPKTRRIARTRTPEALSSAPITSTSSNASQASAGAAAGFLSAFSLNGGGDTSSSPNALMMYSLGGPQ